MRTPSFSFRGLRAGRAVLACAAAGVLVLLAAGPASAHVTVSSPDAVMGGEGGKLIWTVPNESATANTTKVEVSLPEDTPFAEVSVKPQDGWTVTTQDRTLPKPLTMDGFTLTKVVSTITWTSAVGHGIKDGEFNEFEVSVGPFSDKQATLSLPATQTYSDGSVVAWDEPTTAGEVEPDHPVPTLKLGSKTPVAPDAEPSSKSDSLARWLGVLGLLMGAGALAVTLLAARRTPQA